MIRSSSKYFGSSRREALSLYREILRTSKAFHWCDEKGVPWNDRLQKEARKEFEASKEENDPLIIARLLVTGRDCVQQIQTKFNQADRAAMERIKRDSTNRDRWTCFLIFRSIRQNCYSGGNEGIIVWITSSIIDPVRVFSFLSSENRSWLLHNRLALTTLYVLDGYYKY